MKAETASLAPLLRDLYLTIGTESIGPEKLLELLSAARTPESVIVWCISELCRELYNLTYLCKCKDVDRVYILGLWELISKLCYRCIYTYAVLAQPFDVLDKNFERQYPFSRYSFKNTFLDR